VATRIAPPPTSPPLQPVGEAPTPSGTSPALVPLPTLPFPLPPAVCPTLPTPGLADAPDSIFAYHHPPTRPSDFRFEWSAEAADQNRALLRRYDLHFGAALRAQSFSALTLGSEFRLVHLLAPLLSSHPLWQRFADRITDGASFPLHDLSDADRLFAVRAILARGNHKLAQNHEQQLVLMLKDEVENFLAATVAEGCSTRDTGVQGCPLGNSYSINNRGER
jgi:hypothetical protein